MSTNLGLRTSEPSLKQSRLDFIQTLEKEKEFEEECQLIIPKLEKEWEERILFLLENGTTCKTIQITANYRIYWKHYLRNYKPQLLLLAIRKLEHRMENNDELGPIVDIRLYFRAMVQDLRRKEIKKEQAKQVIAGCFFSVSDIVAGKIVAGNVVQCAACYEECGSFSCIRPAHRHSNK